MPQLSKYYVDDTGILRLEGAEVTGFKRTLRRDITIEKIRTAGMSRDPELITEFLPVVNLEEDGQAKAE